ncbi:MAG: hypothetical protein QME44_09635 [Thermodesulfobacteriota bacterium]|nr:hypothetical protein [Thermodesulfobacteriota bacterium]
MPSVAESYEKDSRKAIIIGIICMLIGIGLIVSSIKAVTAFSVAIFLAVCTTLIHLFALGRLFRPMVFGAIKLPGDISLEDFFHASALLAGVIAWSIPGGILEYSSLIVFNLESPLRIAFVAISISTFLHIIAGLIVSGMIATNITRNSNNLFTICTNRAALNTLFVAFMFATIIQIFSSCLSGAIELRNLADPKTLFSQLLIAVVDTTYGLVSIFALNRFLFKRVFETAHLR